MIEKLEITVAMPEKSDFERISSKLDSYNNSVNAPIYSPDTYLIKAINSRDNIIGEVIAKKAFGSCEIKLLHVDENMRGTGLGKKLVNAAEKFAIKEGIKSISIWTFSWQGEGFYEKCGFERKLKIPLSLDSDYFNGEQQYNILYYKEI